MFVEDNERSELGCCPVSGQNKLDALFSSGVLVVAYRIVMKEKWKIQLIISGFGWAFKLKVFRERRVLLKQVVVLVP